MYVLLIWEFDLLSWQPYSQGVPVTFLEAKLQIMADVGLISASDVKYRFRFRISA